MNPYTFTDHIIFCEWNQRGHSIITELRADHATRNTPIVLIASIEAKPTQDDSLFFIQGHVSDETLTRANVARAKTVVILGDERLDISARDARAVLDTLMVESITPEAYTVVELNDESNVRYCKRANADEIIVVNRLGSLLISYAALNHGMSSVFTELLKIGQGNNLYKLPLPYRMVHRRFIEIFIELKQEQESMLLAIQNGVTGPIICNPHAEYRLRECDYLIMIAPKHPNIR